MLSSFGDLPDLLSAEMEAFLEAVEADLREGPIQLGVELAELLVGSVKKNLKGTLHFRENAGLSEAKLNAYFNLLKLP